MSSSVHAATTPEMVIVAENSHHPAKNNVIVIAFNRHSAGYTHAVVVTRHKDVVANL
jgi:hypothetical protein